MLIPKENSLKIYQYLFQEGVVVAKKDFNMPKHGEIDVPNLHVIKALQSLASRGYVNLRFSWQYYYYYLTNEGIDFLREYLHLPAEIVPRTLLKSNRPLVKEKKFPREKDTAAPERKPEFRGGVGRGQPRKQE
jgi:small subunit ribosomal protein S10e